MDTVVVEGPGSAFAKSFLERGAKGSGRSVEEEKRAPSTNPFIQTLLDRHDRRHIQPGAAGNAPHSSGERTLATESLNRLPVPRF